MNFIDRIIDRNLFRLGYRKAPESIRITVDRSQFEHNVRAFEDEIRKASENHECHRRQGTTRM